LAPALGELGGWFCLGSFIRRMIACRLWAHVSSLWLGLEETGRRGAGREVAMRLSAILWL